eukprot:GHVU01218656.1.p1 GENE.GHVU01218656.1~~GHVU01218656.1.p1  ORF type:complete len:121 (-),score=10.25 GHVU01218656.1:147-509(-)
MHAGVLLPPPTFVEWTAYIDQWVAPGTENTFIEGTWDSIFKRIVVEGFASSAAPNVGTFNLLRKVLQDPGVNEAIIDLPGQKLYMRTVAGKWIILNESAVLQVRYLPKKLEFLIVSANGT